MSKFSQSLELLNYKLKRSLKPSVIKIVENEKYAVYNNEYNDDKFLSNENFNDQNYDRSREIEEDTDLKENREALFHYPRNRREGVENLRNQNKNKKYGLTNEDSKVRLDYPLKKARENKKCLQKQVKNSQGELSDKSFEFSLDYPSRNAINNKKYLKKQAKNNECKSVGENSDISMGNSSRNTEKSGKLFQNCSKNNDFVLIRAESEISLKYFSRNTGMFRKSSWKWHRNNDDELVHEDSEVSSIKRKNAKKTKSTFFSALWKFPEKRLKNETKRKTTNISLLQKITVVENPKYLPEYKPSEKEIEEDNQFHSQLQSFISSSEKLHQDLVTCRDNGYQCFVNIRGICNDIEEIQELLSVLENALWVNNDSDLQDLDFEQREIQNVSTEME